MATLAALGTMLGARPAGAQQTFTACLIPDVGVIYMIGQSGLPDECLSESHTEMTWTDGGSEHEHQRPGIQNTAVGPQALTSITTGFTNSAFGDRALQLNTSGSNNTAIGAEALRSNESGSANTAVGRHALSRSTTTLNSSAFGFGALANLTGGHRNIAIGHEAGGSLTSGSDNIYIGNPGMASESGVVRIGTTQTATYLSGTVTAAAFVGDGSGLTNLPSGPTEHAQLGGLSNDDHPQYLLADGARWVDDGFAVRGLLQRGVIPVEGAGTRMMWYPGKAAWRAGHTGTQWDDANIGLYSTATGLQTTASGLGSTAFGVETTASGDHATAVGRTAVASGYSASAIGWYANASGEYATAIGREASAEGAGATALGTETNASGSYATAMGRGSTAESYASVAIGAWGLAAGSSTDWVATDALFVVGNGSQGSPRNALTVYKNGNLEIAGTLTESSDIRLKEEIEPIESALSGVLALTPIRYNFRAGMGRPTERRIGLSAQEVETHFPELVSRGQEGYLSLAYADLSAVLVRAVQEQQEEIESQRRIIEEIATENAALTARLARLERALASAGQDRLPGRGELGH